MKNILLLLFFYNLLIVQGKAQCGSCPVSYSATPSIGTYQTASTNVTFPCQSIEYKAGYFKFKINATPSVSNGSTTLSFVLEKIATAQGSTTNMTFTGKFYLTDSYDPCATPLGNTQKTFSNGESTPLSALQVPVDGFVTGQKTFYGFVVGTNNSSIKYYCGSIILNATSNYLGNVCIASTTVQGPDNIQVNLDPVTISGANARTSEYKLSASSSWTSNTHNGTNVTAITFSNLSPNTSYDFRVKALNTNTGLQSCNWSNIATATTQPLTINTPAMNTATASPTSVSLSWSSTSNTTDYELERKKINDPSYSIISSINGANNTSYTDNTVASSNTYQYKVRAKNTSYTPTQYSSYSNIVNVTTPATVLAAPQNLTAIPNGTTSIGLAWNTVANAVTYNIRRKTGSNGAYSQIYTGVTTANSYTDNTITSNTQYCYAVQAVDNSNNVGTWSSDICATATTTAAPSITACTLSAASVALGSNLTINWTNPNNGGSTIKIELLTTSGTVASTLFSNITNDGSETWTVAGVAAGTYTIKVSSISTSSNAATSSNFTITPNATQNIAVTAPNAASISYAAGATQTITWTSTGITGNFKVELITTSNPTGIVLNSNTTSPYSWAIGATQVQGANYKIRITAVQTPSVFDESDNAFTITNPNQATCSCNTITNPASGEENAAATYLCQRCIIDNPTNGDVLPTTNINKQDLAKILYKALLGASTLPSQYSFITSVIEKYPTPYKDMNETANADYQKYGRVLLYLEYSDGISPFTRDNLFYNPTGTVTRAQVCKTLCETFNLTISASTVSPFSDVTTSTEAFKYIRTCYEKGIINAATSFNPTQSCTRSQAFTMLYRYLNGNGTYPANIPPSVSQTDFALPDNFTPTNMGTSLGVSDGVFDDYSETSFSIPDKQMSLVFAHAYSSNLAWMPNEFFGFTKDNGSNQPSVFYNMRPFGNGWTHNYNAFIKKAVYNTSTTTKDSVLIVCWADGTMNYYQYNASFTPLTSGLFDVFSANGTTGFIVKKKNQVEYYFTKISGTDAHAPYMLTAVKDRNANQITLNYEVISGAAPRLTNVQAPSGRKLTFTYDGVTHRVKTVTDPLSRMVNFTYSLLEGLLATYKDADLLETKYFYNEQNMAGLTYFLTTVQRPKGNQITNSYDAKRKLKTTTLTNNGVSVTRTVNYQQTYGTTAISGTTSSIQTNDGNSNYTTSLTKSANSDISNLTTPTVPSGAVILYDATYPTLPATVTANSITTKYEYSTDGKANVTKVIQDQGGLNYTHVITYNALNDVLTYKNPRLKTTTFVYGDGKNLTSIQRPMGTTNMTYLSGGLIDLITNPEGIQTKFGYNVFGNVNQTTVSSSGISITTSAEYDAASRRTKSYDGNGKLTQFEYNNRDLPTKETNPLNYQTQFSYDNNGNLAYITNAKGNVTQMQYDALDQVVSESFGNSTKQYQYLNDGKLKKIIKPDGVQLDYTYNSDDGLLNNDSYATFAYDARKRLQTVTRNSKALTYGYDNIDRVTTLTYDGQTVGYAYDENNNVTTLTYPNNKVVTYGYDDNDRLISVKDWNNQTTNYTYKLDDRLNTISYPNSVITTYAYDAIGRMVGINTQKTGAAAIYTHGFINDNNGNHVVETKTDPINTYPSVSTANIAYTYNTENRIQL